MARTSRTKASRREFLSAAGKGIAVSSVAAGFPAIVPASVFGAAAPSNRINIGAIGTGRISRGHDLPGLWKHESARIMAVCDLDSNRVRDAIALVNGQYTKMTGKAYDGVTGYAHYRDLLANKDVDAVVAKHRKLIGNFLCGFAAGFDVFLDAVLVFGRDNLRLTENE